MFSLVPARPKVADSLETIWCRYLVGLGSAEQPTHSSDSFPERNDLVGFELMPPSFFEHVWEEWSILQSLHDGTWGSEAKAVGNANGCSSNLDQRFLSTLMRCAEKHDAMPVFVTCRFKASLWKLTWKGEYHGILDYHAHSLGPARCLASR